MKRIIAFLFMVLWLISSHAFALTSEKLVIDGMRYGMSDKGVRIVLDLNKTTEFRIFTLDAPYRLVVDLPRAKWQHPKSGFVRGKIVKSYRSGQLDNGFTRIIFDVKSPVAVEKAFSLGKTSTNKDRLVIDLEKVSKNIFAANKDRIYGNKNLKDLVKPSKVKTESNYAKNNNKIVEEAEPFIPTVLPKRKPKEKRKYIIAIDAGHGGADPGASLKHIKEKHITLATAKELKRQMEESGKYKVVLTRDKDKYVKLRDRVDISRKYNADLFISIHADSIDRKGVRGTSIYTLSEKSSDKETARLAENANNSGFVAGVDLSQESQEVADILLDLAMREKMNESNMYARMVKHSLISNKVRLLPNAHRSAGFAVLKAPDVPSVLIEIGFISNPREAKLLRSSQFQRKISKAIMNGTDAYFRKIKALQKF